MNWIEDKIHEAEKETEEGQSLSQHVGEADG